MAARSLIAALVGAAAFASIAIAQDIAPCPDDYGAQAESYVTSRLDNPSSAKVQIVSEPYKVRTDMRGHSGMLGWAVDIKVRSRQVSGAQGVYVPYTVIFIDGAPVALCQDTRDIQRV